MSSHPLRLTPESFLQLSARVAWLEELHDPARSERSLKDALADIRARLSKLERGLSGDAGLPQPERTVGADLHSDLQAREYHFWLGDYVETAR